MISSLVVAGLAIFFDLSSIAEIGAISMLIIHTTVHIGHLRIIKETGASKALVVLAVLANGAAVALGAWYLFGTSPMILAWIVAFFVLAFVVEILLRLALKRVVKARIGTAGS